MVRLDLFVYFTVSCSLVSGQSLFYGLKGLKVNLKPHITSQPDEILWKHNNNKVIEVDGKKEQVYGLFKNRVTLDHVSAELNISDLRYEDSGEYEVGTNTNNVFDRKTYKLEVIDKVAKPTILCQRDNGSSSTTHGNQATLSCSAESRQPQYLQYEWISHGTVQPGQTLTITLSDDNEEYSCRVSNPLTNETTKFTAKDCFQTKSDKSSSKAWIAGLISAFILVIVVAGILWCKRKNKDPEKTANEDGEEKSPTANGVSQEKKHLVDDQKETNTGTNLPSDSDHHPSPIEADHSNINTQDTNAAHSESEQEKDQSDSNKCEVQSNNSTAKTDNSEDKGETDENQDQSSSKEKQADSDSEDEEQEKLMNRPVYSLSN